MIQRLLTAGANPQVALPVNEALNTLLFELGSVIKQLVESKASVTVSSTDAGYTLSAAQMSQILTTGGELVNVQINQVTESSVLIALNNALGSNSLSSNLINFRVIRGQSEFKETFDTFVERQISPISGKKTTTAVVVIGGDIFHVPTWIEEGKQPIISSLTNSSYALVNVVKHFKDIEESKYSSSIKNITSRLIVVGTSEDTFSPKQKVTRAEFSTMLTKSLGLYRGVLGKAKFNDMTTVNDLNIGISVAADNSFISGYGKGIFKPDSGISAKEMAQMMYNATVKLKMLGKFKNAGTAIVVNDWSKDAVAFATSNGLIEDFANLQSSKAMTREQAAFAIEQLLMSMALINK